MVGRWEFSGRVCVFMMCAMLIRTRIYNHAYPKTYVHRYIHTHTHTLSRTLTHTPAMAVFVSRPNAPGSGLPCLSSNGKCTT